MVRKHSIGSACSGHKDYPMEEFYGEGALLGRLVCALVDSYILLIVDKQVNRQWQ